MSPKSSLPTAEQLEELKLRLAAIPGAISVEIGKPVIEIVVTMPREEMTRAGTSRFYDEEEAILSELPFADSIYIKMRCR